MVKPAKPAMKHKKTIFYQAMMATTIENKCKINWVLLFLFFFLFFFLLLINLIGVQKGMAFKKKKKKFGFQ